jgi:hypothetical protein
MTDLPTYAELKAEAMESWKRCLKPTPRDWLRHGATANSRAVAPPRKVWVRVVLDLTKGMPHGFPTALGCREIGCRIAG